MCRGYFSSQEIDAHHATEHRSTDQSRNGCGMCCFCHAQPFEITRAEKIKSTLLQHSRQNAKVVEAFCHAACRLSNQCRPSIHQPPVDEFRMPAEMSIALSRAHVHARMHPTYDPHSTRCTAGCHTSRDFVPWRFSDAGRRSAWIASSCRRPKTYTKAEALDWTIILPFSQLGGLHGAQWSRSSDLKRIIEDLVTTPEFAKRRCDAHGR